MIKFDKNRGKNSTKSDKFSRKNYLVKSAKIKSANKILHDDEFGDIEIRRVAGAYVRLKIETDGRILAQLPRFASAREVSKLLEKSRENLRKNLAKIPTKKSYENGDKIGKIHTLILRENAPRESAKITDTEIILSFKTSTSKISRERLIKENVAKALRKEAKNYLPRRLKFFALKFGFSYEKVQFTHAKSRWGSCSTSGTISLNIMLMILPNDLLDYVLLHELNHTKNMDHSRKFWADLEKICPNAKRKRKFLAQFSPYL